MCQTKISSSFWKYLEESCDLDFWPLISRFLDFVYIFHLLPSLAWLIKGQNVFYLPVWHLPVNLTNIWVQKVVFLPEWELIICGYPHNSKLPIYQKSCQSCCWSVHGCQRENYNNFYSDRQVSPWKQHTENSLSYIHYSLSDNHLRFSKYCTRLVWS